MIFQNRKDAGQRLALQLLQYKNSNTVIYALPRGGVPVGYEVAKILNLPLEIVVVRKIGSPYNKEFGVGALASPKFIYLQDEIMRRFNITRDELKPIIESEIKELMRREKIYGKNKNSPKNKTVILVDDGLATGVSARVAVMHLRQFHPKALILAVPVCPTNLKNEFALLVDQVICIEENDSFSSVGEVYEDFSQVSDDEVIRLLKEGRKRAINS